MLLGKKFRPATDSGNYQSITNIMYQRRYWLSMRDRQGLSVKFVRADSHRGTEAQRHRESNIIGDSVSP